MKVLHFSYSSDGGAGRAGRRAHLACREAGLASSFVFVEGRANGDDSIQISPPLRSASSAPTNLSDVLHYRIQWEFLSDRRTAASNSLFTIPYPGVSLSTLPMFDNADIIHLHWPTWGATPRTISDWLSRGKIVFWTLHDMWAMTGGCHYSAGCRQYETQCMKCPQLTEDYGFVNNTFEEKRHAYGERPNLVLISPSYWMAKTARSSRIFGLQPIHVVRNPVELDVFAPCAERNSMRAAIGLNQKDFVLMVGSGELKEKRKGVELLVAAITAAVTQGELTQALPSGAKLVLVLIGKSSSLALPGDVKVLNFGETNSDASLRDILSISDVLVVPSLEDNYPNMIIEAMSCGTPVIGFDAGGIGEMIDSGVTGVLVRPVGSVEALKDAILQFAAVYFQATAMRIACRAKAETVALPAAIGAQLRSLYEEAIGRPITPVTAEVSRRAAAMYANVPVQFDANIGRDFLRFPANFAVTARSAGSRMAREVMTEPLSTQVHNPVSRTLITLRTYHEHHSAYSGPYQFVRSLSREKFDAVHLSVPLGADLTGGSGETLWKLGTLMGASAFAKQGNAWLAEAEIFFECLQRRIDIVHFIDGDIAGMLLPRMQKALFPQGRRPKFIATYHQPRDVLRGMLTVSTLAGYDSVVVMCQSQAEFLATMMPREKIEVIPHGIDIDFFRPRDPLPRYPPWDGTVRLLLVGHWLRDISTAIEAFRYLKRQSRDFQLRIVSPRFPETVTDPAIVLLKDLSDEQLLKEYQTATLLFLPLIDATANNAILEAMASGLPVVSTSVGGVPDVVGDNAGILCPVGDASALSAAVLSIINDPDRYAALSLAGRRRAEELTWDRIGDMHERLYMRVVD